MGELKRGAFDRPEPPAASGAGRDYARCVVDPVRTSGWETVVLGEAAGLPLLRVTMARSDRLPTVLVNGGTHGDEPAGLEAALRFLKSGERWLDRFRFEVIPCLNPTGYMAGTRTNARGIDLNWAWLQEGVEEISLFRGFVAGRRFKAVIDLHEDWESPGYYLYEQVRDREPSGPEISRRVSAVCALNLNPRIEGEKARNGVIFPNLSVERRRKGEGIPIALFQDRYTDHLVTSETPTSLALDVRVRAHLEAVDVILESHSP